jgi:hypothetical protein
MREGGTSHKKNSCRYHDLSKTKEGAMIKSMNQCNSFVRLLAKTNALGVVELLDFISFFGKLTSWKR